MQLTDNSTKQATKTIIKHPARPICYIADWPDIFHLNIG
ncbi:hypothetical protein EAKF1_ch3709c [Escherichia albertii KF1]|nr:hypothetical protein EAKF1_ch3709c [Escherichia albertii KF1]